MNKDALVYLCGIHSLVLAAFHIGFWKIFQWRKDLQKVTIANKAIMQILNLRIIYFFLLTAFLCFFFTKDLYMLPLGKAYLLGLALFWLGRLIEQFIFIRINHPLVHVLSVVFFIGMVLFLLPLL